MRIAKIVTTGAIALLIAACGKSGSDGANDAASDTIEQHADADATSSVEERTDPRAQADKLSVSNLAKAKAFLEENAEKEGVQVTDSGLQYMVLEEGPADGATPVSTDIVAVDYAGTLLDGTEFDSSYARGAAATFALNRVIPGWTEGLQLMSEGDKFRFFIPPQLAYGLQGGPGGRIGPNEALIFDVELHKVASPARNLEAAKKFLEENAGKEGVQTTKSGLQYKVLKKADKGGATPKPTDTVKINYIGKLINGTEFGSSYESGEPLEFPLNKIFPAWEEGIQLMQVGDKCRFFVPPALAFGESGSGPIGPNEAVIFDVELVEVTN